MPANPSEQKSEAVKQRVSHNCPAYQNKLYKTMHYFTEFLQNHAIDFTSQRYH